MDVRIEKKEAYKETFLHFSFIYHKESIKKDGLNLSINGSVGQGIYCVIAEDEAAVYRAIQNVKEEIKWNAVADYIGVEDSLDIPLDTDESDYMIAVSFEYTGEYLEMSGEEFGKDVTGFVCIPGISIPANELVITDNISKF